MFDKMIDVSIIIVTWNNEDVIKSCHESIQKNSGNLNTELIIIDNNSSDDTTIICESFKHEKSKLIKNKSNIGFTKAVNQGIVISKGKNILLLNPDTKISENCIAELKTFLNQNDNYGAVAPLLLNEDGSVQRSIRNFPDYKTMLFEFTFLSYLFPNSKTFGRWKMKYFKYDTSCDVRQPMAAVLMIKKSIFDMLGNLDERYFMFFNDVDLCKQIYANGYKIRFLKNVSAVHIKGSSIYKDRIQMIKAWDKDCINYFKKYHNNFLLLTWLKINLKVSELIRIFIFKISKR